MPANIIVDSNYQNEKFLSWVQSLNTCLVCNLYLYVQVSMYT